MRLLAAARNGRDVERIQRRGPIEQVPVGVGGHAAQPGRAAINAKDDRAPKAGRGRVGQRALEILLQSLVRIRPDVRARPVPEDIRQHGSEQRTLAAWVGWTGGGSWCARGSAWRPRRSPRGGWAANPRSPP